MDMRAAFDDTVALAEKLGMRPDGDLGLDHLRSMRERIVPEFSPAKLGRWLGWAQAAVVANTPATLEDMKSINRARAADTGEGPSSRT